MQMLCERHITRSSILLHVLLLLLPILCLLPRRYLHNLPVWLGRCKQPAPDSTPRTPLSAQETSSHAPSLHNMLQQRVLMQHCTATVLPGCCCHCSVA
ncbi:hypothetical protein COO60DRAFT_1037391 [Scenedesmus sp. NREL 46B-D3]|nr:hypothetical protein COO60DRAFT_1037391 [Scenedesmus sp. NREL 46B-D3]